MKFAAASTVIDVAETTRAPSPLPEVSARFGLEALLTTPPSEFPERNAPRTARHSSTVEAWSSRDDLVAGVYFHPVLAAAHLAFDDHRPLGLSPDIVWLLIVQGFAHHINAAPEGHRQALVRHQGRVSIEVRRDDFVKGSPENPWPEVFETFSASLRDHLGPRAHDLLLPTFSTTGPIERAAAQVALLDVVQSYFSFELVSLCGIPQVVLEGTAADWHAIAERTADLGRFGLAWWTDPLAEVLREFVAATQGDVHPDFWRSIYKLDDVSGGPHTTGWITAFFPYLVDRAGRPTVPNPWIAQGGEGLRALLHPEIDERDTVGSGPKTDSFPGGLARAPFTWNYLGHRSQMEFLGGFVGVRQDPETLRLTPVVGWAIRESDESEEPSI